MTGLPAARTGRALWLWCLALFAVLAVAAPAAAAAPRLDVYVRQGCPRCADAKEYLQRLSTERPELRIEYHWVDRDRRALDELTRRSRAAGVTAPGVPSFAANGALVVGFESPSVTGPKIARLLAGQGPPGAGTARPEDLCPAAEAADCEPLAPPEEVETRIGTLSVARLGLPLFTVALGLLDGFNPCATWVLVFLISMLAGLRDRRRLAVVAGVFVVVSGVVYFAFMAAWLNVFLLVGISRALEVVLGALALVIGAINVKDFFAFGRGLSLSIPEKAKPGIYARVRAILRAPSARASLAGVTVLAVLVNFIELLCTAGLPAVYTAILTRHDLSRAGYYAYLGLYNLAYVADDALLVTLAVLTLSRRKLTERAGRGLKLVSGVVMLALAGALLFAPELLF